MISISPRAHERVGALFYLNWPLARPRVRGYTPNVPLFRRATFFLLVAALAVSARAGVVAPAGPVFAPPAGAWGAVLGPAFNDPGVSAFLPPALGSLSLTSPESLRTAAPLVQSLKVLAVSPKAFAAMPPPQRAAALELAVEDAKEKVRIKVYELAEKARDLSRPGRAMDKESRAELYGTVSKLMEMRDYYGPWLDEHETAALEEGYKMVTVRAWEVRTSLLKDGEEPAPAAVKPAEKTEVLPPYVFTPSSNAWKRLEDVENNPSDLSQHDLDALYTGFDFTLRQGGKHRIYTHPRFKQLHDTVPRQNSLPHVYGERAAAFIRQIEGLKAAQYQKAEVPKETGPPANLTLADLSILLSPPKEKAPKPKPVVEKATVVERIAVRAPPAAVPARVAERAAPVLAPSKPAVVEAKPEPPPVKTAPQRPGGLVERIKIVWSRMKGGPN